MKYISLSELYRMVIILWKDYKERKKQEQEQEEEEEGE